MSIQPMSVSAQLVIRVPCHRVRGLWQRLRGLIGQPAPATGTAWLFARCAAVHTWGMGYPIDVVFLDLNLRVLRCVPTLAPRRMAWCLQAAHVLELRAHEAQRLGLRAGVLLRVVAPQEPD